MSIATRAATCTACGKRLNRKRWYYRNGKYFCKKRCWMTEQEKAAKDAAKPLPPPASQIEGRAGAPQAEGQAGAPAAEAKPAPAAEAKPTPAAAGPASGGVSDAQPPPATPEQPASS